MTAKRYKEAGVDLEAAQAAKLGIADAVASTNTELSRSAFGAFAGMIALPQDVERPLLLMSTDGVGTKVLVAIAAGRHVGIGEDLVNHCVNDLLVHGARPIAFQDYLAVGELDQGVVQGVVEGIVLACRTHAMVLTGGETAQLPDLYAPGHYDVAGTILGIVGEDDVIRGDRVTPGDVLVGYAASGLHTNGYTLARKILFEDMGLDIDSLFPGETQSVGDVLLATHRSYYHALTPVLPRVHGLVHVTGGGMTENIVRVLPEDCVAVIDRGAWTEPNLFQVLRDAGAVDDDEMRRVFNLGVGMVAAVSAGVVDEVRAATEVETWVIGEVVAGARAVRYR